ncbi:MAG: glycosyltransferase [Oscillospiraceae bacterium]|nr:glycosyltransferase [Oscillospiraceae bacterium]
MTERNQKLLSVAVPCYNSAAYMEKCVESLLHGGEDIEIILVDDGSADETPAICDRYAGEYPDIIKAVHQPNGGHGDAINTGLKNATGLYFKVVDSDDWLDSPSLIQMISRLKAFEEPVDLIVCNYVYENAADQKSRPIRYAGIMPENRVFTWEECRRFAPWQYLLMHAACYRSELLKEADLTLPKHTFYVDNVYVYQPLPFVKSICYLNLDLYRYFIGRADQSINEKVMVSRANQQLSITKIMIESHNITGLKQGNPQLARYMINYLSMMVSITTILFLLRDDSESYVNLRELWRFIKECDKRLYRKLRYHSLAAFTSFPGRLGRRVVLSGYRAARSVFHFN